MSEYPFLATQGVKLLSPFSITYLCQNGFLALVQNAKSNWTQSDLRFSLSTITPDSEALIRCKNHDQFSHLLLQIAVDFVGVAPRLNLVLIKVFQSTISSST
ncbi:hypothetical protein ILYODFUR_025371 [Ilyodon furcidens]|uniref:Uncharacterized protein n=1 Tax=Ilyodon furcidens TaxID=33524 RepID=A0ABV0TYU2_9TELE